MITAGVDIGSSSAKAIILNEGSIIASSIIPTGPGSAETALRVIHEALSIDGLALKDITYVVATGYGRINVPFANKNVTEISCHARGIVSIFPQVRTILDMGGQDCKAIRCDETGRVLRFLMNEKCAAGTGRYLERISKTLKIPLQDLGPLSLQLVDGPARISSFCTVFAQSDVMLLVRQGRQVNDILAGVCESLVERTQSLIRGVGIVGDLAITGGIAKNIGVVSRFERKLGTKAFIAPEPQIVGALGAALIARDLAARES